MSRRLNTSTTGKENVQSQDRLVLGPLINGVRRPVCPSLLNQQTINQRLEESREEIITPTNPPSKHPLKLKGAGPKIKTKDGSKVHLKELIKSREEIKNVCVSLDIDMDNKKEVFRVQDDSILKYKAVSVLEDSQAVRSVCFHPNGNLYAVGANSRILRICDMPHIPKTNSHDHMPGAHVVFKRPKYHRGSIYCMAWSPDGKLLATGSNDKSIKFLQFDPDNFLQTGDDIELNIHNGTIRDLAFVPNRLGLLVSGGAGDGCVNVTDTITQQITGTFSGHSGNVLSVYAGEGDLIATGGTDNTLRIWDLRSQRCIDVVVVGDSSPASVALSESYKYMASGQEDGTILLYDLSAGRTLQNFRMHQSDCRSVRFSNDTNYLLTGSYDCTISIMNLTGNLELNVPKHYTIAEHTDKVIQCRWHPTDDLFLSSSADRTCVLWKA